MKTKKHLTDLEDRFGRVIPIYAMIELSKMTHFFEIDRLDVSVNRVEAIEVNGFHPDILQMKQAGETSYLKLKYDLRVNRRKEIRAAMCENTLYFAGLDKKYYRLMMINSTKLRTRNNMFDNMMMSVCYSYFKHAFEQTSLRDYRDESDPIYLPENYASVDLDAKEFYDGYLEFRNAVCLRIKPMVNKEIDESHEIKH